MVRWGQIPAGFEVLSTEELKDCSLNRRTLNMLPEAGCSADNIAAERRREEFPYIFQGEKASTFDRCVPEDESWELCTALPLDGTRRLRVQSSLRWKDTSCCPLVRVIIERKLINPIDHAEIEKSLNFTSLGICRVGLDARTIALAVGGGCFGVEEQPNDSLRSPSQGNQETFIYLSNVQIRMTMNTKSDRTVFDTEVRGASKSNGSEIFGVRREFNKENLGVVVSEYL